jgi:magnesium chelatase accessory protein
MNGAALRWSDEGADWPHRQSSQFIAAGGTHWHVQRMGQGPVLLLLHGSGASSHSWRDVVPLLISHFTLLIPDLPGHGFTAALPAQQMSMQGVATSLKALLDALQLQPDWVVGHSAGAAVLVRMCLNHSIAPQALISLNGALLPLSGLSTVWFAPVAKLMANSSLLAGFLASRAQRPGVVQRLIDSTGSHLDAASVEWYARLVRHPAHVAGVLQMMANWDLDGLRRDLPALTTPIVLVVGLGDRTVDPGQADRTAVLLRHARVVRLPQLGHLAHEEAPQLVADLILQCCGHTAAISAS